MMARYRNMINASVLPVLVYALTFSLFLGTAVFSIVIAFTIPLWLMSGEWDVKFQSIKNNPVVLSALLLFLVITLGLLWSHVPWSEKLPMYMKYHKLLYIPMIVSILQTDVQRKNALNAFLIVSLGILFISYGKFLGLLPFHDEGMGYVVTRNRIAHGIFMAFAAFLMLHRMVKHQGVYRWVWMGLSLLVVGNVMFLVNGRTGQVILLALLTVFIWQQLGTKSIKYFVIAAILGVVVLSNVSIFQHSRLSEVGSELKDPTSSSGLRIGFYKNSLEIVKKHPLLGVGTGAFKAEYHQQIGNFEGLQATSNPHNQYLLIAVETGLVGLLFFLFFLASSWRISLTSEVEGAHLTQGLVVLFSLGCLFNSLLFDAGEGRFYCTILGVVVSGLWSRKVE